MAINLDAFPPDVKLALISAGEEFSSDDTFAQATQTGQGLEAYAATLKAYGLPLSDTARLGEARALLSESGYGRNQARSKKKTLGIGLDDANRAGRTARIRGRSILTSTKSALSEQSKTTFATDVQTTLDATADSEKTGEETAPRPRGRGHGVVAADRSLSVAVRLGWGGSVARSAAVVLVPPVPRPQCASPCPCACAL